MKLVQGLDSVRSPITTISQLQTVYLSETEHYACVEKNDASKTYCLHHITSLIHSKIDYCNSLLLNLPAIQTNRLQLVLNSTARVSHQNS